MKRTYTCSCGMQTTDPFIIRGEPFCTLCAETINPKIVQQRTRKNWKSVETPYHEFRDFDKLMRRT